MSFAGNNFYKYCFLEDKWISESHRHENRIDSYSILRIYHVNL